MASRKGKVNKQLVVYQAKSGAIELRGDVSRETVWATRADIVKIFGVHRTVVSRHIRNILADKEISAESNVQKMHVANSDKPVDIYSLDVILAVGYRTNSKVAIAFRRWATKTLRGYIVDGYAINRRRVAKNYERFSEAVRAAEKLLPAGSAMNAGGAMELVLLFADTWLSLDAYDRGAFAKGKLSKRRVAFTAEKLAVALGELTETLRAQGAASELFGVEKHRDAVAGIVGNVMQTYGGKELYPTAEEKAAHLLYFMVKNHPFADGNKRSGAYAFVWFLRATGILDPRRITAAALTALTLLVAESNPAHKERIIGLVVALIRKES